MSKAPVSSIHEQLVRSLQMRVRELRQGDRLPSIRKLMDEYRVNQLTVERCLSFIEGQGSIVRKARSGIFVTDPTRASQSGAQSVKAVGVIVPSFVKQMGIGGLLEGLERAAAESGWIVQVCNASLGSEHQMEFIQRCITFGTKAVVVLPTACNVVLDDYCDQIRSFVDAGLKLVCVDLAIPGLACDLVRHNGFEAFRQATEIILKRGCRRLCYLGAATGIISAQRLAGIHHAINECPNPVDIRYVSVNLDHKTGHDTHTLESARALTEQMPVDTDALIVGSTVLFYAAAEAIEQMGRTVNEDLIFVASVNEGESLRMQPTIALQKSMPEAGRRAFELMAQRIADPGRAVVDCRLPFRVVVAPESKISPNSHPV